MWLQLKFLRQLAKWAIPMTKRGLVQIHAAAADGVAVVVGY